MSQQDSPQAKALIINWQLHVLETMNGALIGLRLLNLDNEGPAETVDISPLAINLDMLRKLHGDLGDLISLMDRSPGTTGTA